MKNKLSNYLWGLFFIFIGIGFAGNVMFDWDFDLLFPGWWTLLFIIPFFISMVQNGFRVGATLGFIISVLVLASYYVELNFSIWQLVIPAILILIGIRIMFQGSFHRRRNYSNHNYDSSTDSQRANFTSNSGGARQEYMAVFSSNRIHITETFTGASLSAVFGSVVLDLRDAQINGDIEISAQAIFGGIDIFVPAGVNVKVNNVPVFGGVSNKAPQYHDSVIATLYLNSTCMFGGIDIK